MDRVVVVGGVAGGASAAARIRRLREDIDIIMLEMGQYVSFANCGLPYYVGDIIKERDALELVTPARFRERFNIDARVNHKALSIDRVNKRVKVKDLEENFEYDLDYTYLILSPGAEPVVPSFKGLDEVDFFVLRTIPDSEKIVKYLLENKPERAVVVGGGFIGIEMAENLCKRGLTVHIIEMLDQVMAPVDREMAQFVHSELISEGCHLVLGDAVDSLGRGKGDQPFVKTKSGKVIETDFIIMSIGVKPESKLAKEAGLELGDKGHIIVNEFMQTSDTSIYAVGDAVEVLNFQTEEPTSLALAGPANKQGRIAADNICGRNTRFNGVIGTCVVKIFDMTVAAVGLNEKALKTRDIEYEKIYLNPDNHADYYPGAEPINFKLLFEVPSGKILGAQAVGGSGSEKRIDVISSIITMGGTVYDLEKLELSYAPPFGSAKDPVNMAGFIACNVLKGDAPVWHWHGLEAVRKDNGFLLDVRTVEENKEFALEGSLNIHIDKLRNRLEEIPDDKPIYVYCDTGIRSYLATRILLLNGYKNVFNLTGGIRLYKAAYD